VYSAETVYQVDSVPYRVTSGYRNSTFNYGDKLTVCYNPENPAESYVSEAKPDSGAANIIFGAVVLVFTLVGWQRLRRETSDSGDTLADSESEFDFD
jgi:hypothetical protein